MASRSFGLKGRAMEGECIASSVNGQGNTVKVHLNVPIDIAAAIRGGQSFAKKRYNIGNGPP
jgi:hypothetical protein